MRSGAIASASALPWPRRQPKRQQRSRHVGAAHPFGHDVQVRASAARRITPATIAAARGSLVIGPTKRLVDLQDVDRQQLQVRQRALAGAEIVDGDRDATRAPGVEFGSQLVEFGRHAALGQLDADLRAAQPVLGQRLEEHLRSPRRAAPAAPGTLRRSTRLSASPASRHCANCRHVVSMTQCCTATKVRVCSDSGTNTSALSSPRCGCCHRSNASTPTIAPVARSNSGW